MSKLYNLEKKHIFFCWNIRKKLSHKFLLTLLYVNFTKVAFVHTILFLCLLNGDEIKLCYKILHIICEDYIGLYHWNTALLILKKHIRHPNNLQQPPHQFPCRHTAWIWGARSPNSLHLVKRHLAINDFGIAGSP